jgi:hypothetical protein
VAQYCNKKRLAELIEDAQATGVVSDELAVGICRIAEGVWLRKGFGEMSGEPKEDFCQDVAAHVLKKLKNIDPDRQPFNYLTTLAIQRLRVVAQKNKSRKERKKKYIDEKVHEHLWELRVRLDHRHLHETWRTQGNSRSGYT